MTTELPIIRARGITRHYPMGANVVKALDGVDLNVWAGDLLIVMGSSGSGKSTLMHIMGLLDRPDDGSFEVNGVDVARQADNELSAVRNRHIGFVFQQFNLLSDLSVVENIALPLAYSGIPREQRLERARHYAERLGLGDRVDHLPTELSGGQMQRVAIARALVNEPDILLADEPTGNLDSRTSDEIMEILYELHAQGHTIIMVSHDPRMADQGTRRITLKDGRIVDDRPGIRERALSRSQERPNVSRRRAAGLGFFDLLRIGLHEGLLTHGTRTFLTMLGIIIGVSSVIAMSSFSLGSKRKQADQIRALGANLVRIVDKRLENERLTQARMDGSQGLGRSDLDSLLSNTPQIQRAATAREVKLSVMHGGHSLTPRVLGVSGNYLEVNNLELASGRPFDEGDRERSSKVAILGHSAAEKIGLDTAIGTQLLLGGVCYTVVGVLKDKHIALEELEATSIADPNNDLLIPLETLLARTSYLDLRSEIDEIQLQLATEDDLYSVGRDIRRILGVTHNGVEDYDIIIPMDLLKQKQQSQRLLDILTACISSISILVGGIGIMNIMLASVTERIREIGIRRAIGATRRDIQWQFLSESVIIAVTGGGCGVLLALGAVGVTCRWLHLPVVFSLPHIGVAVLASTLTGLIFGIYPAFQAANKDPVEALRYE